MESEKTKINLEDNNQTTLTSPKQENKKEEAVAEKKPSITWREVSISGVKGIVWGAASVLFTGAANALDDPDAPTPNQEEEQQQESVEFTSDGTIPTATSVTDDMSFGEAFAAARQEMGPGGVFEWHGNIYNTYYAEEWNSMNQEEQANFGSHITTSGGNHEEQSQPNPQEQEQQQEQQQQGQQHQEQQEQQQEVEPELEILSIENYVDEEGPYTGVDMIIAGNYAVALDDGSDDSIEFLAIDANANGNFEDNEILEVADSGLTISQLQDEALNSMLANGSDMPDYINDADPSGFLA